MANRKGRTLSAVPAPTLDPTLPTVLVPTADGDIKLCLDCGALIDAEEALIRAGHPDVDLLMSLHAEKASEFRIFFVIAAQRFHPEIPVERLRSLVTLDTLPAIKAAISKIWILSMAKPKKNEGKADPIQPVE